MCSNQDHSGRIFSSQLCDSPIKLSSKTNILGETGAVALFLGRYFLLLLSCFVHALSFCAHSSFRAQWQMCRSLSSLCDTNTKHGVLQLDRKLFLVSCVILAWNEPYEGASFSCSTLTPNSQSVDSKVIWMSICWPTTGLRISPLGQRLHAALFCTTSSNFGPFRYL